MTLRPLLTGLTVVLALGVSGCSTDTAERPVGQASAGAGATGSGEQGPGEGGPQGGDQGDEAQSSAEPAPAPAVGRCRVLSVRDVALASNDSPPVDCREPHSAETFVVEQFPARLGEERPGSSRLGAHVFDRCERRFETFLGGTESLVMRTTVTWAWFRPTPAQWRAGSRWFRCDVISGGGGTDLVQLPRTAEGLLLGRVPDTWLVCADGEKVADSPRVPCSARHTWRAVTTIVLGEAGEDYPGDRLVGLRTRDFCSKSVGAWLDYPVDYDYGFTFFGEAEWETGNRRSICWARTSR